MYCKEVSLLLFLPSLLACSLLVLVFLSVSDALPGGCCGVDGSCSLTEPTACLGRYLGELSQCSNTSCNGACCCNLMPCFITTQQTCKLSNCTWNGGGTTCSGATTCKEMGACCSYLPTTADPLRINCTLTNLITCNTQLGGYQWTINAYCNYDGICPLKIPLFKDPLPIIPIATPVAGNSGCSAASNASNDAIYTLSNSIIPHDFCSLFPNTISIYSYNGVAQPHIISTCENAQIALIFTNGLPFSSHLAGNTSCVPVVTPHVWSIHNHGMPAKSKFDGVMDNILPSASKIYYYTNPSGPRTYWYHDHGQSVGRNLALGSVGFYLVESRTNLNLPTGALDVPLVLADKLFYKDMNNEVRIFYANKFSAVSAFSNDEYVGTVAVVNNKVTPFLNVSSSLYRFRLLNAASSRSWILSFGICSTTGLKLIPFYSIGGEQEFSMTPFNLVNSISLGNGERVQILFDFSQLKVGTEIFLINSAKIPFPNGDGGINISPVHPVMKMVITSSTGSKTMPTLLPTLPPIVPKSNSSGPSDRSFVLDVVPMATDCDINMWIIRMFVDYNNASAGLYPADNDKSAAIVNGFSFEEGSVARLSFWNPSVVSHPIHIHAAEFKVIRLCKIDMNNTYETLKIVQEVPWKPEPHEALIKDTIKVPPGYMMELLVRFTGKPGFYIIHCHILEHEDHTMNIFFYIKPASNSSSPRPVFLDGSVCGNNICEAGNGENCNNCPSDCLQGPNFCCGYSNSAFNYNSTTKVISPLLRLPQNTTSVYVGCTPSCNKQNQPYLFTTFCKTKYILSYCGDGWCELAENINNCPADCTSKPDFFLVSN